MLTRNEAIEAAGAAAVEDAEAAEAILYTDGQRRSVGLELPNGDHVVVYRDAAGVVGYDII